MDLLGLQAGDCVMVGDRLYTDIRMARAAGMASALVLTGETTAEALAAQPAGHRPTWVLDRIDRLLPEPLWSRFGWTDAGAIVAAIEACTGATCEVNVGKPDPLMLEAAMELLGLEAGDCVMVGDRLYTDIRMARAAGMASALVMTGDTPRATLDGAPPEDRPTWVLERVDRLLPPSALAPG